MYSKEFLNIIAPIVSTEEFQRMKGYKHHTKSNLYEHSIKVAYYCYKHHKRFNTKIDLSELVIGALLHDYYLYDLHGDGKRHKSHWRTHPRQALKKATEHYPNLTHAQKDMIEHHMFPLNPAPPKTRAGWLVCFYDKIAAVTDRF